MRFKLASGIRAPGSSPASALQSVVARGKLLHFSVPVSPSVKWER